MNALDLARWQFGITTVYHFIFVPLTIGLSILPLARWFYRAVIWDAALPYLAITMGWIFTVMGRQPWTVFGVLRASQSVSAGVSAAEIITSMTVFILIFTPVVLLYQGWTYWVFRKRLTRSDIPAAPAPSGTPSGGRGPGPQAQAIHGES